MRDEHLNTIPEKESDEFIKSCVETLFPNPSESEDFSNIENSTSSDDKSSHEEVIYETSFKTYSNPLFDLDEEIISRDTLFLERLLHDDPILLSDTLDFDFSNVVRVFLPFFTYLVTSAILLSSGSEDIIFDPDISNYHFSSLEPGVSHRSRTFMKSNVYPNHLNESPMMIHGKNIPTLDVPLFHFYPH
nr:hypothetical protein [Tanacetum cinerariifolium]